MRTWQLLAVLVALVAAWFIDRTLFYLLAAVSGATLLVVRFGSQRQRNESLLAPLREDLRRSTEEHGVSDADYLPLALPAQAGGSLPCLRGRVPVADRLPFCLAARHRHALVELPALVRNVDLFDSALECEIFPMEVLATSPLAAYEVAASSPSAAARLLSDNALVEALDALADSPGCQLASFEFDGVALRVLLATAGPKEQRWLAATLPKIDSAAAALAQALGDLARSPEDPA